MTIIVEDGTGLSNANAYVSVADVSSYATDRGLTFAGATAAQEQAITKTTDYIDSYFKFLGTRVTATQALAWPRTGVTDRYEGYAIPSNIIPQVMKKAVCELAIKVSDGTVLLQDLERGSAIKSATVGPVSVTYTDDAPTTTLYGIAGLLKGLLRDENYDIGLSGIRNGSDDQPDALFSTGQFDNPNAGGFTN